MKINLGNVGCFGVGLRIVCYGNMKFCLYGEMPLFYSNRGSFGGGCVV